MNQVSVENFVGVLKSQGIRAEIIWENKVLGKGRVSVSRGGTKALYLFEEGYVISKFVEQVARKFGIDSSLFFPSENLGR